MEWKVQVSESLKIRAKYMDQVTPFINKSLIKVFTGQRRVGKSYLLFQIMAYLENRYEYPHILYINKEDLRFSFIKHAQDLHNYVMERKSPSSRTYVFIDEIQDIQDFASALRSLALDPNLDIYCTGSNAHLLSSDVSGYLSGRAIEFNVYSLSYSEFLDFHEKTDSDESMELFLKYGGLPYLMHLELTDTIVFEYLKNIYQSIVYRDVINRYEIRNVPFLEQLVQFIAGNTGSLFSARSISQFLKSQGISTPSNQVQTYLEYLCDAFIIRRVPRFDIPGKRVFETGDKFYFENLGVRHGIYGYRIEDRGKILENVVYNHMVYLGYDVKVGVLRDTEIDFVCQKDGERVYLQVALTIQQEQTMEREFGNLARINDHYPKKVITLDKISTASFKGIEQVYLRDFIK